MDSRDCLFSSADDAYISKPEPVRVTAPVTSGFRLHSYQTSVLMHGSGGINFSNLLNLFPLFGASYYMEAIWRTV
jgi:hypothetical protein